MAFRPDSVEGVDLTEKIVLTRTRAADLDSVKKLNCWASNICDVSVVRRMPNLEVCSLSINRISTLQDFAHCHKLKELYVRTNRIGCLGDIHYLKHLRKLRSLWLSENLCAEVDNYRLIVLRSLPHLQKLDNTAVTPEEVQQALILVEEVPVPQDFSASGMFHPGLSESSVSSVSSVLSCASSVASLDINTQPKQPVLHPCDQLPVARKKREQRRMRKSEEELVRRSGETGTGRGSVEEEEGGKKLGEEKGGSASDEYCSEDDGKKSLESENREINSKANDDKNDNNDEVRRGVESVQNNGAAKDGVVSDSAVYGGKDVSKSALSNHLSDESSVSGSCDSSKSSSNNDVNDDVGNGGDESCSNDSNIKSFEEKQNEKNINDNNNDSNNNDKDKSKLWEVKEISMNGSDSCANSFSNPAKVDDSVVDVTNTRDNDCVVGAGGGSGGKNIMAENSLLNKIRLNDSLAMDEGEVNDSIELDDLILEVEGESSSKCKKTDDTVVDEKNRSIAEKQSGVCESVIKLELEPDSTLPPEVVAHTTPRVSPRTGTQDQPPQAVPDQAGAADVRVSKVESVDWDEYNRLRQDVGMRPMEPVMTKSRSSNSDNNRTRNTNILQAVLSLVKELDKDSLDLVSAAVNARRDNL